MLFVPTRLLQLLQSRTHANSYILDSKHSHEEYDFGVNIYSFIQFSNITILLKKPTMTGLGFKVILRILTFELYPFFSFREKI